MHPRYFAFICPGEFADGRGVFAGGPAGEDVVIVSANVRAFLRQSVLARVGFAATLLLFVVAVFAPWIAPANPAAQGLATRLEAPSGGPWMGTDELGRDALSRVVVGARVSLTVAVCVVFGCGVTGLIIGSLAGYFGGWWDRVINLLLVNAFLSFPGILLAIAFAAFFGPGIG